MIKLTKTKIREALPKIEKGLGQYLWIQNNLNEGDVSKNKEFRKNYNLFYGMGRFTNSVWQTEFFNLLEISKHKKIDFESILKILHKKTGRMEASFASKLVATINPKMPVIDSIVLKNIGWRLPHAYKKDRHLEINKIYQNLVKEFHSFLQTDKGKYLVEQFIKKYPKAKITKVKMLDFVLWQTRD